MEAKKLFLLVLLITSFYYAFSQDFNQKLLVKYDSKYLEEVKTQNNYQFDLLNYFVDKACYVVEMPEKEINYIELKKIDPKTGIILEGYVISENDIKNLNPLEYNIKYQYNSPSYYKVGNSGNLIIVPSESDMKMAIENKKRVNK